MKTVAWRFVDRLEVVWLIQAEVEKAMEFHKVWFPGPGTVFYKQEIQK